MVTLNTGDIAVKMTGKIPMYMEPTFWLKLQTLDLSFDDNIVNKIIHLSANKLILNKFVIMYCLLSINFHKEKTIMA